MPQTHPPQQDSLVALEELSALASKHNLIIPTSDLPDYSTLLAGPKPRRQRNTHNTRLLPDIRPLPLPTHQHPLSLRPIDTDKGGWAWKPTVKNTKPKSNELEGKAVALKDNVALAGVQCTNGTGAVDWVPNVDATLVMRLLNAGGVMLGTAACENNCFGVVRYIPHHPPSKSW